MNATSGRTLWPLLVVVLAACSNGSGSLDDQPAAPPPSQGAQTGLTIGGSVAGLTGTGLVLQNNGAGDLSIPGDGSFTFPAAASSGAAFAVTVLTQPSAPNQTCTVANGTGTLASANVTNIVVTCSTAPRYTVGVTVSGLAGTGLVLLNNAADNLTIPSNGNYLFATALAAGSAYTVTVGTAPNGQNCLVRNATGTIAAANVTNVQVECAANQFTVGGSVSGLAGAGLVLQLNDAHDFSVVKDGPFAFPAVLPPGAAYAVIVKPATVVTKPAQDCVVTNGTGTIVAANIETVAVTCTTKSFPVGGEVSGLVGTGLVLQLNDANDLAIQGNGIFAFPPVKSGTAFKVTVKSTPTAPVQECTPASASGTVDAQPITTVRVTCATKTYNVGGTVIGLAPGASVVLQNNGADNLTIAKNGKFKFAAMVASGGPYGVTVLTHPTTPIQQCGITNGSGTVANAHIDDIVINCSTTNFSIGGTVNNLVGSNLELSNGADRVTVSGSSSFEFPRTVPSGSTFDVRVVRNPIKPQQTCTVDPASGTGSVINSNVTSVVVNCVTDGFTIGGTVSGLRSGGLILRNNGLDDVAIAADGPYTFPMALIEGSTYSVSIAQSPLDPTNICFVAVTGAGTVGTANVTNADISCF